MHLGRGQVLGSYRLFTLGIPDASVRMVGGVAAPESANIASRLSAIDAASPLRIAPTSIDADVAASDAARWSLRPPRPPPAAGRPPSGTRLLTPDAPS